MSGKSITWFQNFEVMSTVDESIRMDCNSCVWSFTWQTCCNSVSLHKIQEKAYLHYLNCRKAYQS